ncbi:MAG: hypothetical protein ACI83B_001048 [Sediminicola sp.]|jgi:hypothetical protein|tara:strand:- start:857 stop:1363 length:507 start_codon:yes stop_codon:yes gene_type:complete
MEERLAVETMCTHCKTKIQFEQKFCVNCGFPQGGSKEDQSMFHAQRVIDYSKTSEAPKLIRKARNTLFIIAGFSFSIGLFYFFYRDDSATLISSSILAIIYLILGYWSQRKPLVALILALLVFLTTVVLNALLDPAVIARGLLLKAVIVFFLIRGINSALHIHKSRQI